jgi:hypothetical protein
MKVLILITVASTNFAIGVLAAAFFGRGPTRFQRIVKWIEDPPIKAPGFVIGLGDTLQARWNAFRNRNTADEETT